MLAALRYDPHYYPRLATQDARLEIMDYATTMSVGVEDSFEGYWKSRKKKLRDNVSRYFRRVDAERIELRFEVVTEPEKIARATDEYGDLESAGWKGRAGTAVHSANVQGRFYSKVLSNFAVEGNARVFRLFAGDVLDEPPRRM